ncbi:MAG TPA: MBOAT family O-acyltransferase [Allosphingosinicella sp.]|nr:MBOAT family O-acyltransferase [Allosphingosinicella sp.]
MVFSSLIFLFLFLPVTLTLYYVTPWRAARNLLLVSASLLFYAWGEPVWVVLLLLSATVDYWNGRFIEHWRGTSIAWLGVASTLIFNLGVLAVFKYSGFVVENLNALAGTAIPPPSFALPLGISFYVFMSISYTIDVWRGEVRAERSYRDFLVYIANFHHLVAGPIIRFGHIAREIHERVFRIDDLSSGVSRFCKGLFKKVCIANVAGELALPFLGAEAGSGTMAGAWLGTLLFSLQIYFDFSGYSDMAIGLGRMFGFHYHENFAHPYAARSITDFWRRWHISLSSFFRDYVYIPLGGNRHAQVRNILIVWALTGLWHGASWNFLIWGCYYGVLLLIEKFLLAGLLSRLPALFQHGYALFFVVVGWTIFYFTDFGALGRHLSLMFGLSGVSTDFDVLSVLQANAIWLATALILCWPVYRAVHERLVARLPAAAVVLFDLTLNLLFLGCSIALLVGSSYNPFIYFRF